MAVRACFLWVFALMFYAGSALGSDKFSDWKERLRAEALEGGISAQTFDSAFKDVNLIERVVELDRKQPEFTLTLNSYLDKVISNTRVRRARQKLAEHKDILNKVSETYGVQPRFIVALWGIETNFGQNTGGFGVIPALTTLAYDGRRASFFRKELLNALKIIEQGHISADKMKGSWAGAMGQCQFMPSSFLSYAEDFNNAGKQDIWNTKEDVFASIATYLRSTGWRDDITWGREVLLPEGFDGQSLSADKTVKSMDEWRRMGLRRRDGSELPARNLKSRLVLPRHNEGRAFLAYQNYDTILRWNRSNYFAVAVGTLADKIQSGD